MGHRRGERGAGAGTVERRSLLVEPRLFRLLTIWCQEIGHCLRAKRNLNEAQTGVAGMLWRGDWQHPEWGGGGECWLPSNERLPCQKAGHVTTRQYHSNCGKDYYGMHTMVGAGVAVE